MQLYDLLAALVGGTAVGVTARALADRPPLWMSVLAGVAGSLLGTALYLKVFGFEPETPNIDWWQHFWQLAIAAAVTLVTVQVARLAPRRR
ncbi:hypothetical protein ACLM5J_20505 [Nocardioides sp. Bht2]|uniref:hypothetical protein n=1 Tax=Nocardioides sp. Bht2 TaxID=3392297 RepID=UPI0039B61C82